MNHKRKRGLASLKSHDLQTRAGKRWLGKTLNTAIEPLIDAHQAAEILKLHPVTVREMAGRHEIPAMKIGKVWRFRASALDRWIVDQIESRRHPQSLESEER